MAYVATTQYPEKPANPEISPFSGFLGANPEKGEIRQLQSLSFARMTYPEKPEIGSLQGLFEARPGARARGGARGRYLPTGEIPDAVNGTSGFSMFRNAKPKRRPSPVGRRRSGFAREVETGMLKLTLIGNLGSDPEMQYAPSGQPRLRFNVAGNYRGKNQANEWEDRTEWVRVTVFGNRAESLSQILRKGTKVYVDGRLEARPWTGNDGALHAGLEMVANEVELCSPRQQDDGQQMRPTNTVNRRQQGAEESDLEFLPF